VVQTDPHIAQQGHDVGRKVRASCSESPYESGNKGMVLVQRKEPMPGGDAAGSAGPAGTMEAS
jgi:hypothetical protein